MILVNLQWNVGTTLLNRWNAYDQLQIGRLLVKSAYGCAAVSMPYIQQQNAYRKASVHTDMIGFEQSWGFHILR